MLGARTFVETIAHLYPPEDLATFLAEAYDVEHTKADLADPAKAVWLVEADGQVVGHALAGPCNLPHPEVPLGRLATALAKSIRSALEVTSTLHRAARPDPRVRALGTSDFRLQAAARPANPTSARHQRPTLPAVA